jgi:hypothetical protein
MSRTQATVLLSAVLAACGASGTRPHDMSVARHEEAAGAEDTAAGAHAAEYDTSASAPLRCGATGASVALGSPCWTSDVNSTEAHRAEAARHREAAAAHRAAAEALRAAEAAECAGLSEADRDQSPFSHRDDIASVTALTEEVVMARTRTTHTVGARIVLRAVPGLTAEWLQRVLECHLARNASLGHDVPEMPYCPLVPAGVTVEVGSVGDGFAIDVRAVGDEAITEVVRRARTLTP